LGIHVAKKEPQIGELLPVVGGHLSRSDPLGEGCEAFPYPDSHHSLSWYNSLLWDSTQKLTEIGINEVPVYEIFDKSAQIVRPPVLII
jgi:hypothetical protein